MALGKRARDRQAELWVDSRSLAEAPGHPFYQKLNEVLSKHGFDEYAEGLCAPCYADRTGRPSVPPGVCFRMLMVGCYEGLDSERGIDWRASDSLALRRFLGYALTEATPDHSTLSRIRHRLPLELRQDVVAWILTVVAKEGLLQGKTLGATPRRWRPTPPGAVSCAATRGDLPGVSAGAGARLGDRDPHPGAVGQVGPEAPQEGLEPGLAASL